MAVLAVAASCLGAYLAAERSSGVSGLPLDDSFIHLQFARSIADGYGLAFRPGRLVSGSTAPLWTAVLSLLFVLPGPLLFWVKLLGAALYVAGAAATWALARELDLSPALAAGADAALPAHRSAGVVGAVGHGGGPLRRALARRHGDPSARAPRARRRRPSFSLALFGLAALARPEGLLLLVLAAADRILVPAPGAARRESVRGVAIGALCAAAVLAAFAAVSFLASGSILPTTYAVKTDGPRQLLPSGLYLLRVVGVLFRPHPLPVLLALAGVLRLCERLRTPRDRGLLPALWVVALPLAYALYDSPDAPMMVGNFGRYYFPLFPFVLVLAALALEEPLRRLADAPARVAGHGTRAPRRRPPGAAAHQPRHGTRALRDQRAQRRRERRRDVALDPRAPARGRL